MEPGNETVLEDESGVVDEINVKKRKETRRRLRGPIRQKLKWLNLLRMLVRSVNRVPSKLILMGTRRATLDSVPSTNKSRSIGEDGEADGGVVADGGSMWRWWWLRVAMENSQERDRGRE
ncbi:hypothetical protein Hanom_Chr12g01154761 [Helianthus anomalus]